MRIEPVVKLVKVATVVVLASAVVVWIAIGAPPGINETAPEEKDVLPAAAASTPTPVRSDEDMRLAQKADVEGSPATEADAASMAAASAPAPAPASAAGSEIPAAWSLADSRVAGDDRAPPIERSAEEAAVPAWQLDNHPAYARREQDRHQAVQRAFVGAADRELPLLDRQIEQGRAMGVPPEQLAKGEEKRRRIAEMRARMQVDLAASASAP